MKKTQIAFVCALSLVLAGTLFVRAAEEGRKEGKATVRTVHGKVEYLDNATWLPVRPNMKFDAGVTVRTGADGTADLSVNGLSSAVRITNNTTLQIPNMTYVGSAREGDTTTMLNLVSGSVLGNVKKITANSRYEIMTPHGVAGVRGTDFSVDAIPTDDHKFTVTFKSITGTITVSAVINGITVTHTLTTGTSWVIGETPKKMAEELVMNYQNQILGLVTTIDTTLGVAGFHGPTGTPTPTGGGTPTAPGTPTTGPGSPTTSPFNGAGQPLPQGPGTSGP
jgi:hypothetical protein